MSDPKNASDAPGADKLDRAMKEAMDAVERREREARGDAPTGPGSKAESGGNGNEIPIEVEGNSSKSGAEGAVTEALIKAKHELESVLGQTQKEAKELRDKWLRAAADLENYKKRATKEREDIVKFGMERLFKEVISVLDDFDRTLQAADQAGGGALVDGVRMVHKKMLALLEKNGVTTFESKGLPFDPALHEAVQQVASADVPAGAVADEISRGYMLHGRLLRPALVAVSVGKQG